MFASSSPFGQSAGAPFGAQSPFGQNNVTNNAFGATNAFGSQSSGSLFGSTSTGVFGQSSTPAFGAAASSPAFGTSMPAFGSQSSSFGGSSAFGQKPFGGFGTSTQTSPFGNSSQQSQPAFSSNTFGSTAPFGAPSQPSFGGTTTPAFGSSNASFGATSTPAFASTPPPSFGSPGAFGSANTSAFGQSSNQAFGAPSTPSFGVASTPAFGQSSNQAFGASSSPSFGFNSTPALGQATPFGSTGFGSTAPAFNIQGSSGAQTTTPGFGSGALGQSNLGGSRVTPYLATADTDGNSQGKLESISAMQAYKEKNHEELRWEDYQRGDKGGPNAATQSNSVFSSGVPGAVAILANPNPFGTSQTFGQSSSSLFSIPTPSTQNAFTSNPSPLFNSTGFGTTTATFGSASSNTVSTFGAPKTTSPFGTSSAFSPSPVFGTPSSAAGSSSLFASTQGQTQMLFGTSGFGNQASTSLGIGSGLAQGSSIFGQTAAPSGGFNTATNSFATSGFPNSSFSTGGQLNVGQSTPSLASSFQPSLPSQSNSLFNFSNAGLTPAGGAQGHFGQNLGQSSGNQISAVVQPVAITNPFGTLPAMPHMSIGNTGASPSIQYGISSMPVVDKPAPIRVSSLLTSRHLSTRRIRLPARKYNPNNDGSRVAFFSEEDETPSTPKADARFIPRENPRALIIRPVDQWTKSYKKDASLLVSENGKKSVETQNHTNGSVAEGDNGIINGNGLIKHPSNSVKISQKPTDRSDEHGANIEATIPKCGRSDYYTEPQVQELAAKERAEPGYCKHVKDFVVGRRGYGSIKFLGETDVRGLDVESVIQFNDREVIVYMDDSKKPPVGQGLNKPAEVTLLNIKYNDRKTGKQILEGPKFEKYKEMLKKKAEDQGAEYLSYDPAKAEWKFRVRHFSKYSFGDDDSWDNTE